MKTLDKKLFVILKYIVILIPLGLTLFNMLQAYFVAHQATKLLATEQNENVWQYRDNQYDNYEGGSVMEFWIDSVKYGNYNFKDNLTIVMNGIYNFLPKVSVRIGTNTTTTDPITLTMAKVSNYGSNYTIYQTFNNSTFGQVCHCLYYAVIVELIWTLIYLFRWFIQFGYGLFDKERKL